MSDVPERISGKELLAMIAADRAEWESEAAEPTEEAVKSEDETPTSGVGSLDGDHTESKVFDDPAEAEAAQRDFARRTGLGPENMRGEG